MSQILPVALQSMQNDSRALERIANNIANVDTPAYRREVGLQPAILPTIEPSFVEAMLSQSRGRTSDAALVDPHGKAAPQEVQVDPRHGTLRTTGESLDVALLSGGCFEVHTDAGPAYTRDGRFERDASGRLVTIQGHAVMGRDGEIRLAPGAVTIDRAGRLTQEGRLVGQLRVVDFDMAKADLHPEGSLYAATDAPAPPALPEADVQIRQGALENSNVDHATEMIRLMQVMRHFESMTRVAQGYDEMVGNAIRKLGEF